MYSKCVSTPGNIMLVDAYFIWAYEKKKKDVGVACQKVRKQHEQGRDDRDESKA